MIASRVLEKVLSLGPYVYARLDAAVTAVFGSAVVNCSFVDVAVFFFVLFLSYVNFSSIVATFFKCIMLCSDGSTIIIVIVGLHYELVLEACSRLG